MDRNIYQNNNNNSLEFFLKIVREIKKTNIAVNLIFITLKKLKILNWTKMKEVTKKNLIKTRKHFLQAMYLFDKLKI
jgi:hypothetical protein